MELPIIGVLSAMLYELVLRKLRSCLVMAVSSQLMALSKIVALGAQDNCPELLSQNGKS